ncbi:MarR family winged helix-turn-helix transcriptional regulator [Mycobacterium sp. NPDC048908]|uniref:MarR family winged helix-turn-helix transcriptional regulator n=1 Tax=Mycobacterium sp. NPDC048908 TaxID=3364292 RepID=UPI00371E3ADF
MTGSTGRTANLVGALSVAVTDRIKWAVFDGANLGGEAVAALVAIGHSPGMTITQLGSVLERSHPAAVRIVDRLQDAKLVKRDRASGDRRSVTLTLTSRGFAHRHAILDRRQLALQRIVDLVEPADRRTLERLAAAILGALPQDAASALAICRYCDEQRCGSCPMEPFGSVSGQAAGRG